MTINALHAANIVNAAVILVVCEGRTVIKDHDLTRVCSCEDQQLHWRHFRNMSCTTAS